jgi:hypothetical protein
MVLGLSMIRRYGMPTRDSALGRPIDKLVLSHGTARPSGSKSTKYFSLAQNFC